MKTNYLKSSLLVITALTLTIGAKAQTEKKDTLKESFSIDSRNYGESVDRTRSGEKREHINTEWHGKTYTMTFINNKMTDLYVDGAKIPAANWGQYSSAVAALKEQLRKDRIQAAKDRVQAQKDEVQAKKDEVQAKLDQEQAARDQVQAKRDAEQASRDQVQAKRDQEQAAREREDAEKGRQQAALDQEQAMKDQQQAKRDEEQALRDQQQAKKDQEHAADDLRTMKLLVEDLVKDKIVPDEKSVHEVLFNNDGLTVNGVKQPDEVYKRYKEKYGRYANSSFNYSNGEHGRGIRLERDTKTK